MKSYIRALSIAGSDPSGGAGIQADLKTFSALGVYGMTAITAVVDENTIGVSGIHAVPARFVEGQIRSCLDDIGADAVKIGMLHSPELVRTVRRTLEPYRIAWTVLDPVMVATSGDALAAADIAAALREDLIPAVDIITPNIPEAEALLGRPIGNSLDDAARELSALGGVSVLLKGGHMEGDVLTDVFYNAHSGRMLRLTSPRTDTVNTHGTGCTLSSALASFLARGASPDEAARMAKDYITAAIAEGAGYRTGHGHGPVHHFHALWQ